MENTRKQRGEEALMDSDSYLLPIIKELHNPAIYDDYCFKTINFLALVKELIDHATCTIGEHSKDALLESGKKTHVLQNLGCEMRDGEEKINVPHIIGSLSSKITREILNGNDAHSITLKVLEHLSKFRKNDKVALTLVAFALTFGEFWLLVRLYANNAVNELNMTTDQRELTSANKEAYINQIEANNEFIKILANPLQYFLDIDKVPLVYIDNQKYSGDREHIDVYWIIRCAIAAATQIIILSSRGLDQYLVGIRTPEEFEKLIPLNEELMSILSMAQENIKANEAISTKLQDNVDIIGLMKVIISDTDMPPLYHGETKRKDHLDVLREKRVLLLISGIDILPEDITSLKNVNINTRKDQILWVPVIDHSIAESESVKNQLEALQNSMPWYSVHQPSLVTNDAVYLFKYWGFYGRPMLVILCPLGKVLTNEAIHMVRIWQNLSVDELTSGIKEELWQKETWNLNLLINDIIDPIMQKWIRDERYIVLYGGNDIDWIRKFTRQAHSVASDLKIHMEIVYVGESHNKDLGREVQNMILSEQLSHCLPESSIAYFWTRINSMIRSKISNATRGGQLIIPKDKLFDEMLRFEKHKDEEWVLLARGSTILINGSGQIALNALEQMEKWKTKLLQS